MEYLELNEMEFPSLEQNPLKMRFTHSGYILRRIQSNRADRRIPVICGCGQELKVGSMPAHLKTNRHRRKMERDLEIYAYKLVQEALMEEATA